MIRLPLTLALLLLGLAPASAGSPRDEVLRVAPPDAALVVVLQNARDHVRDLGTSPFAEWFPTSALGKQLLGTADLTALKNFAGPLFAELKVTPEQILDDILGDAAAFAFSPSLADKPAEERAVILIRPRKAETLAALIDRLNAIQTKTGEVKEVAHRKHNGVVYAARQKPDGSAEFYCFRGGVFAFSSSEPDIQAVIDRDKTAASVAEKTPELTAKLTRLGVADAMAVLLVNPRPLDAEVKAKLDAARPEDKAFLNRFREAWDALDAAAVYVDLGRSLEVGVALRFRPDALPAATRDWLTGRRVAPGLWPAVPDDALFAAAFRLRAAELLDTLGSLMPEKGKATLKAAVEEYIGPVIGKDKLPGVLAALGPDWALWAAPPAEGQGFLPVGVAVVQVSGDNPAAGQALLDAVDYGFRTARVVYNATHADQIEVKETRDGDVLIRSLANAKRFPPGVRPSFALKGGYLIVASSPEAIKAFKAPAGGAKPGEGAPLIRFSASATRAYLTTHRTKLAKFLAESGAGDEKELLAQFDQFVTVLEPLERIELVASGDAETVRVALRVQFVKPLKK